MPFPFWMSGHPGLARRLVLRHCTPIGIQDVIIKGLSWRDRGSRHRRWVSKELVDRCGQRPSRGIG